MTLSSSASTIKQIQTSETVVTGAITTSEGVVTGDISTSEGVVTGAITTSQGVVTGAITTSESAIIAAINPVFGWLEVKKTGSVINATGVNDIALFDVAGTFEFIIFGEATSVTSATSVTQVSLIARKAAGDPIAITQPLSFGDLSGAVVGTWCGKVFDRSSDIVCYTPTAYGDDPFITEQPTATSAVISPTLFISSPETTQKIYLQYDGGFVAPNLTMTWTVVYRKLSSDALITASA